MDLKFHRYLVQAWGHSLDRTNLSWHNNIYMASLLTKLLRLTKFRRNSKEVLRLEKERFDVLVNAVTDYAIFALDKDGFVKTWNAGAERFKGYKPHEILGKHFSVFYPEKVKESGFPETELIEARKHGRFEHEGLRVRKDGSTFLANVAITAIYDKDNNLTGFLKVTRDISELKNAEESLKKLNEDLENRVRERTAALASREAELKVAKDAAVAANDAKSSFLANMSHEIRTPLGAILGFSELLAEDEVSGEERLLARDAIKRNGQVLSDLINDILDLSKVEANRLELDYANVDLEQFATEIRSAFKLRAESKNIEFSLNLHPGLPPNIWTDGLRLKQIVFNVVGNAMKFTRQGSVKVEILKGPENTLCFEVLDTGLGISSQQAKNLFVPFQQADASITREYGGTGLGLILSKRLAQALGGDLVLNESVPKVGTKFTASIRLQYNPLAKVGLVADISDQEKQVFVGKKILVVDDNPDNRTLIVRIFKPYSVLLESANDGKSGIEKALSWNPDLILMDLQMPVMGGIAATEELRRLDFKSPIIALTAHALKEEKERCLALGFDAYITKPIDKALFFSTLSKFLQK